MALREIDFRQEMQKAAPDAATIESGEGNGCGEATSISKADNITGEAHRQGFIESILLQGAENAISAQDLTKLAGLSDTRYVTKLIQTEREAGAMILSTPNTKCPGYYLPADGEKGRQEIAEYVRSMICRAAKILRSVRAAKAALEIVEGQQRIEV